MLRYLDERKHNHLSTDSKHVQRCGYIAYFSREFFHDFIQVVLPLGRGTSLQQQQPAGVDTYRADIKADNLEGSASDSADGTQYGDATSTPKAPVARNFSTRAAVDIMSPNEKKEKTVPKSAEESGESEYSAPKFMSLVCIMQMVKLMDAVGILFPQTLPEGTQPITTKREFLDQFATAKMSAHIDCPNCKAFVSYRWYANDVKELKTHLATSVHEDKKVRLPAMYTLFASSE
jgi:hypothetical protein